MGWERRALIVGIVYNGDGVIQWVPCSATGGLRLRASLSHRATQTSPSDQANCMSREGASSWLALRRKDGTMRIPHWSLLVQLNYGVAY